MHRLGCWPAVLLLFAGCPAGPGGIVDGGTGPGPDGGVTVDGGVSVDGGRAAPASIVLSVTPQPAVHDVGQSVVVTALVADADGDPLPGLDVAFSTDVEGIARPDDTNGAYTLIAEGAVVITGCVSVTAGADLCDAVTLLVDAGRPDLVLESPLAGAELGADGTTAIEVRGTVTTTRAVDVEVNGALAPVDGDGGFVAFLTPAFGVNHVEVTAQDAVGDAARVARDVLWAPTYTAALDEQGRPQVVLDDAATTQLGQDVFDDGQLLNLDADPLVTGDIADLVRLVMTHLDHHGYVADPVVNNPPTLVLQFPDVHSGPVEASLAIVPGGIEVVLSYALFEVATAGSVFFDGSNIDLTGTVSAPQVTVQGVVDVDKPDAGSPVAVTLNAGGVQVTHAPLTGVFDDPEATAGFGLEGGLLRTSVETELDLVVRAAYETVVPAVVQDLLAALDDGLVGQSQVTSPGPVPDIDLVIDGALTSLDLTPTGAGDGALSTPLSLTLSADTPALHPASRGVADPVGMDPASLLGGPAFVFVMRLAVLNGILHSLWNAGQLELDATSRFAPDLGPGLTSAIISGKLAPVLRPATPEEGHDLMLGVGQIELELVFEGITHRYGYSLEGGADVAIQDGALALTLLEAPRVEAWPRAQDAPALDETELESLFRTHVLPELLDAWQTELTFLVPSPTLGDLGGLVPTVSGLTIETRSTNPPQASGDLLRFELALRGTTDVP